VRERRFVRETTELQELSALLQQQTATRTCCALSRVLLAARSDISDHLGERCTSLRSEAIAANYESALVLSEQHLGQHLYFSASGHAATAPPAPGGRKGRAAAVDSRPPGQQASGATKTATRRFHRVN
jgi:hypothetical protein